MKSLILLQTSVHFDLSIITRAPHATLLKLETNRFR